jgi:hypothetical protein
MRTTKGFVQLVMTLKLSSSVHIQAFSAVGVRYAQRTDGHH